MTVRSGECAPLAGWPGAPYEICVTDVPTTLDNARARLLAERSPDGTWEGELSPSALSTAVACLALELAGSMEAPQLVPPGLAWLVKTQNPDGGWGDTPISKSNISTTLLCAAALNRLKPGSTAFGMAVPYLREHAGYPDPDAMAAAVAARYGKDRTFSAPILMTLAVGGLLGTDQLAAWKRVLPLPFELAAFPRSMFAALRLPVVSYALPALIAIGYARFHHAPPSSKPVRALRNRAWPKASRLLSAIQPQTGGYLEATPLTAFVTIALASSGQRDHAVVTEAARFLAASSRPDGAWPIDSNLATWVTTLAANALPADATRVQVVPALLARQEKERHPFTLAAPGGWSWTPLAGGLPDADDTAGALVALAHIADPSREDVFAAAKAGCAWLADLQNRDGGIPTFCKGWGTLPFDRSSCDITAHAVHAWNAWDKHLPPDLRTRTHHATHRALAFLTKQQHPDGSFAPLWFGNEHLVPLESNLTYGTAALVRALATMTMDPTVVPILEAATQFLIANQNADGGWGGGSSGRSASTIEETALALDALATLHPQPPLLRPCQRAAQWLADNTSGGTRFPASPIGFYFAKLWYFEMLYPLIWTVSALAKFDAWPPSAKQP
ncbi:prenyltransferase/squalene oxidase repeat-containing protein [soil metagenome]